MDSSPLDIVSAVCRHLKVEAYLVGGPVRDRFLRLNTRDWDLVVPGAHRIAKEAGHRLSAKVITLDEHYRIYRIVQPEGVTIDIAEMQGKTIQQDLARRDFTINAMAYPLTLHPLPKGEGTVKRIPLPWGEGRVRGIIDPFNGQKDLTKKILRAVSQKAFKEDPLRLLRAYRMAAQFNLSIEPRTARWIAAEHRRLEPGPVARERVREEFLRLLKQPHAAPALFAMDRAGLLTTVFPDLEAGRRVGKAYYGAGGVVKHHLQSVANVEWIIANGLPFIKEDEIHARMGAYLGDSVGGFPRFAWLKLGALLHDTGKPATAQRIKGRLRFFGHEDVGADLVQKLLQKLRFSRQETLLTRMWVRNHMRLGNLAAAPRLTDKAAARYFRDMGEDAVGMLIVSLGDHYTYLAKSKWGKGTDPVEQTTARLLSAYVLRRDTVLPPKVIDGHVLMKKLRLKPGPVIGKLLEAIRDAQAEGKVRTVEEAIVYAKSISGKVPASPRRGPSRSA